MLVEINYPVQCPTLSAQPHIFGARPAEQVRELPSIRRQPQQEENTVVAAFVDWVNALGPLSHESPALMARMLMEVKTVARHIDVRGEKGAASGYDRRVLCEDPGHWSLAVVALRPGQSTECHDHSGWGCAATVQGIERNQVFAHSASGELTLSGAHDYPQGTGYVFDAADVHQPLGADPERVTVALHFLVHESHAGAHAEVRAV